MDAWLLGFFGLGTASVAASKPALTASKAPQPAAHEPAHELRHRQPQPRIAHWDKKREKCRNCSHIYLKTLSRHPGFCSVDCKSNAAYMANVSRTIRAVKDAVDRHQQSDEPAESAAPELEARSEGVEERQAVEDVAHVDDCDEPQAQTFADFGLETRVHDGPNVQWAFSAVY